MSFIWIWCKDLMLEWLQQHSVLTTFVNTFYSKKKKHLWIPLQEIKPMFANKFQSFQHLAPCRPICSHFKCFIWLHFLFLKFFMQLQVAYLIYCWIFFDRLQWSTRISKRICSACLMKRQILSMFFYLHIINLGRLGFLGSRV